MDAAASDHHENRSPGEGEGEGQQRQEDEGRRTWVALALALLAILAAPGLALRLLPGLTAAALCAAALARQEQSRFRWLRRGLLLLMASLLAPTLARTRAPSAEPAGARPPAGGAGGESAAAAAADAPLSGELVPAEGGSFALRPDPAGPAGEEPDAGWQRRLLGNMTGVIRRGEEQVVMVFSRAGCPWCDRQLPVLERAIQGRAGPGALAADPGAAAAARGDAAAALGAASAPQAAPERAAPPAFAALPVLLGRAAPGFAPVAVGAAPGRPSAPPLRVFVFDSGEFASFAQAFNVEAFPTTIAWGAPGVTPMAAQGYLDDSNLDELLCTVAQAAPGEPGGSKRRGLFR